jgi:hypothetical protein
MRENRTSGSEGREPGNSTRLPYLYRGLRTAHGVCLLVRL